MENQPTLANVRCKRTQAGPKMGVVIGLACQAAQDCTRSEPGVKHPVKVTPDGLMERGNPSRALSALGRSRRPGRMPRRSRMSQEGNAQDTLTWDG
jgi:hypothetical protein